MKIAVECYPDKVFVESLGFKARHAMGKYRVLHLLKKGKMKLGLVDFDYGGDWMYDWKEVFPETRGFGFLVLKYKSCKLESWLICLVPRLEDFLIKCAREVGLNLKKFKLSEDPDELHSIISHEKQPYTYKLFLKELFKRSERIKKLKGVIDSVLHSRMLGTKG